MEIVERPAAKSLCRYQANVPLSLVASNFAGDLTTPRFYRRNKEPCRGMLIADSMRW